MKSIQSATLIPDEVVRRFAFKRQIPYELSLENFDALVNFLDVAAFGKENPSAYVDEAWHEFILHTQLYGDFCRERYGRFVHHTPTSPTTCKSKPQGEEEGEEDPPPVKKCASGNLNINRLFAACSSGDDSESGSRCSSDCRSGDLDP